MEMRTIGLQYKLHMQFFANHSLVQSGPISKLHRFLVFCNWHLTFLRSVVESPERSFFTLKCFRCFPGIVWVMVSRFWGHATELAQWSLEPLRSIQEICDMYVLKGNAIYFCIILFTTITPLKEFSFIKGFDFMIISRYCY